MDRPLPSGDLLDISRVYEPPHTEARTSAGSRELKQGYNPMGKHKLEIE